MGTQRNLDAYEARRLKGIALHERGYRQSEVAVRMNVSRQAVSQWLRAWREGGEPALKRVRQRGRPPRLKFAECLRLAILLQQGATAHGYPDDQWNGPRMARLIQETFGVILHPKHIRRLIQALGWARHKPTGRAVELDEDAIARWNAKKRSDISKRLESQAATGSS